MRESGHNEKQMMADYLEGTAVLGLGADAAKPGFDTSFLVSAASEIAQRGMNVYNEAQAKKEAEAKAREAEKDADAKAAAASALDAQATEAAARVALDPNNASLQTAAAQAASLQDEAGQGLSPAAASKRFEAAKRAKIDHVKRSIEAAKKAADKPGDTSLAAAARVAAAYAKAAGATVDKLARAASPSTQLAPPREERPGFILMASTALKKERMGLPTWGWILAVLGLGGGTFFFLRRRSR